ncbi:hypothetical protein GJ744_008448 [Endocarpon pusillum]|uniref:Uncharacterized protein n=1 Tax=Endocarpon pusillum TaxID=364733 RepID=A0A8H7E5L2_9EURO|nr:hypothetical protein GJ744_008448 [Endocarpon pusillum]
MIVGAAQPLHLSELSHALATSEDLMDYTAQRIPRFHLIEELCSNLILFDRTSKGSESDPLLKVAHKSIQDFFLQDPDSLDVPENLRQYFVSPQDANLELGQASLAYLNFVRYYHPQDVVTIIDTEDHAFLKHAATFWYWYLCHVEPSEELFKKVEIFLRSGAFWTCVAVQSRIAPHLFSCYKEMTEGGYRLERAGPQQGEEESNVSYAVPLPSWLDDYAPSGSQIVQAFHDFIKEWHLVLNSHPLAGDQCAMDRKWESDMGGRTTRVSDRVKRFHLSCGGPLPSNFSPLSIVNVRVHRGAIVVAIFGNQILDDKSCPQWFHSQITSESVSQYLEPRPTIPVSVKLSEDTHIFSRTFANVGRYSVIDPSCLQVQSYNQNDKNQSELATNASKFLPPNVGTGKWRIVCKSPHEIEDGISVYQRAVAFHFALDLTCKDGASSDFDSGHQSSNGDSDSDASAASDASEDLASGSEGISTQRLVTHNSMLIVQDNRTPVWHFWKSAKAKVEVRCAFHPVEQLAVWSSSTYELCILNLTSKRVQSTILPEPASIQFSPATAMYKEFHFSEPDHILFYLLYTAVEAETGVQQTVSVSSFHFSPGDNGEYVLRRTYPMHTVSYECTGSIQHPLILTSWGPDHLYIALPPLSCNAKILRLRYSGGGSSEEPPPPEAFQTLCNPVYFPSSTPYRHPRIKVLDQGEGKRTFTLALDADISSASSRLGETGPVLRQPPALMTWDIGRMEDWRDWKASFDERSAELQAGRDMYNMLRGTFVDEDKRFNVVIRSGLDWRKKAFLSCG